MNPLVDHSVYFHVYFTCFIQVCSMYTIVMKLFSIIPMEMLHIHTCILQITVDLNLYIQL